MKKYLSKALSAIISVSLLCSSLFVTSVTAAPSFSKVGGWNETIYAELSGVKDADVTSVSYSGTMNGTLEGEDFQYLVRDTSGGVRIDIPGLKAGTYSLTVNTSGGSAVKENITVPAQDRSGYAHFNYTQGIGAYNDDGTLKANAKVLYVTDANKESVTVSSSDGTTVSGIGNILNSAGSKPKTNDSGKVLSNVINTNQDIIRKLALDGTPLVVRFIGSVKAPAGLTAYDSNDYGGTPGDNGFMARMQSGKDVTLEGIGYDTVVDGWGFHFIAQSAYKDLGKSFEVRNIEFRNVPEDCVGMEGVQSGSTLTASVERCWIHNCDFYAPSISNPAESDKAGGDGACDFKRGQYFTNSYCYYNGYHKTNLVGASDSNLQFNITYHHNYWKNCESRGPLGRQANIHMYNNVFEGQTSYCMNTRANCYIFSESNLFYMCKNPQDVRSGAIKSYNDSLSACIESANATVVKDKSQKVSSGNRYENFDTDPSLSYIPSNNYKLEEDLTMVKKTALACAGSMAENVLTPEEVSTNMILSDRQPTAAVQLPYDKALNSTYVKPKTQVVVDNIIFNASKGDSSSITFGSKTSKGQDIVFKLDQWAKITMTDGGATYPAILMNDSGVGIITGTGSAVVAPGTYFIQSSGFTPAKGTTPAQYKESKLTHLTIVKADGEIPTVPEPTTQATTATVETSTQATTEAPFVSARGDVNKDKVVDAKDASIVLRVAVGAITDTTPYDMKAADCNTESGDGKVDILDAIWILNNQGSAVPPTTTTTTTTETTTETTTSAPAAAVVHNFTDSGKTSSFFTIDGNLSSSKGSVDYNGMNLTQCLKIESRTSITFNAPSEGTLVLVFGTSGKANCKIDGTKTAADSGTVLTTTVSAGSHTISKADTANLFYMSYTPN